MHISDGVLPVSTLAAGWIVTTGVAAVTLRRIEGEALPRTAVMTAVFFAGVGYSIVTPCCNDSIDWMGWPASICTVRLMS